jgi:hypothetical protein
MKKSITIGKMMLKSALAIAGCVAFCYIVGEPTDKWTTWAADTFGWFSFGWLIFEKAFACLSIYLIYKVNEWIGPVLQDDELSTNDGEE